MPEPSNLEQSLDALTRSVLENTILECAIAAYSASEALYRESKPEAAHALRTFANELCEQVGVKSPDRKAA